MSTPQSFTLNPPITNLASRRQPVEIVVADAPRSRPPEMNTNAYIAVVTILSAVLLAVVFTIHGYHYNKEYGNNNQYPDTVNSQR